MSEMHETTPVGPVVVGVDGSEESWPAVTTAAWEARARGVTLVIAHGYLETYPYAAYGYAPYVPYDGSQKDWAHTMLTEFAKRAGDEFPDLRVETHLAPGGGSAVLIRESQRAGLLVVGARGHGGFGGLSIGSVAAQVAAHAHCPVLVVRPFTEAERLRHRPILVGVDGSDSSVEALRFACAQARRRGVAVIANYVWFVDPTYLSAYDADEAAKQASAELAAAVAEVAVDFPDVEITQRAEHGIDPSHRLIELSAQAGLTVTGCRGRGGFTGLLLGSTSRDLVGHANSPVVVVHTHRDHS